MLDGYEDILYELTSELMSDFTCSEFCIEMLTNQISYLSTH
jgi:hypothetical protein